MLNGFSIVCGFAGDLGYDVAFVLLGREVFCCCFVVSFVHGMLFNKDEICGFIMFMLVKCSQC